MGNRPPEPAGPACAATGHPRQRTIHANPLAGPAFIQIWARSIAARWKNLAQLARPLVRDQALEIVHGLIERLVIRPADEGSFEIELVGDIARMVELGTGIERKKAALDEKAACSVKVVAGTCNHRDSLVRIAI